MQLYNKFHPLLSTALIRRPRKVLKVKLCIGEDFIWIIVDVFFGIPVYICASENPHALIVLTFESTDYEYILKLQNKKETE